MPSWLSPCNLSKKCNIDALWVKWTYTYISIPLLSYPCSLLISHFLMRYAISYNGAAFVQLIDALELSKLTMVTVKQNLWWAFAYNIVSFPVYHFLNDFLMLVMLIMFLLWIMFKKIPWSVLHWRSLALLIFSVIFLFKLIIFSLWKSIQYCCYHQWCQYDRHRNEGIRCFLRAP